MALVVVVGNGWYRGRLGFSGGRALYGSDLGVIAELHVTFTDGHRQTVLTDETWRVGLCDVLSDDLYDGQTIDARRRPKDWHDPSVEPGGSLPVRVLPFATDRLVARRTPVVRRHETLVPAAVWRSPSGRTLVDFGQNIVGWLRFTVQGPGGSEIRIRHAEVLEHDELGTRPLRDAQATDRFILSGGVDHFEPTMTFHGFRYAEVSGWPGELTCESLEAVVVHSDLRRTGSFECSDPLVQQFHRNVVWGMKGNFVDIPMDCPQRDERLGWTGDIAAFAPTACYLFDVEDFLGDWLVDLGLEQSHAHGRVPYVVPDILKKLPQQDMFGAPDSVAIWSDAAVWVPWTVFQTYGNAGVLEAQFESMCAHVRRVEGLLSPSGLWDGNFQFGDWLDPDAPPDAPWKAKADSGVVATACFHRSASIVAQAAQVIGRSAEAREFRALAERTRAAFNRHYVGDDGLIESDCATVYTLAIVFGLLDDEAREIAGTRLAELVRTSGHRISTGFAGTPFINDALTITGHLDDAFRLLLQRECPSWLYPVTMGATTVWERWDSMLPDGTINPGEMTSFNHYALGAVADWMHRVIGGLVPLEPGYSAVRVAPRPGGGLTWARTSLETSHGTIEVAWRIEADELIIDTVVPDGVRAVLSVPGGGDEVLESGKTSTRVRPIDVVPGAGGVELGASRSVDGPTVGGSENPSRW